MKNVSKWVIASVAAVTVSGAMVTSTMAVSINTLNSVITESFDGMGTTTTLPTDWVTQNKGAAAGTVDLRATSLTSTSSGSSYVFANGSDNAIGFLNSGSFPTPNSITINYTNNTGATITGLNVAFDYEKYRNGSRAWTWTFASGTDASTSDVQAFGGETFAADGANGSGTFPPSVTIAKSGSITGLSLAPGASYYFKWTMQGAGGNTNGQALAIDNFSLTALGAGTPVPEPTSLGLLGLGALGLLARRRKSSI